MASTWYKTGSVNVTNGSTSVTGTNTYWQTSATPPEMGDIFTLDNDTLYEIDSVDGDGELTLASAFTGATSSGSSYAIIRNSSATVNTRLAAQVTSALAQKQTTLDELTTWLSSENETETLTDAYGDGHDVDTPYQMTADVASMQSQVDTAVSEIEDTALAVITASSPANIDWDVEVPFNDGIQVAKGYGTNDQIDVSAAQDGSVMVELPSQSVDFSRASDSYHLNKSGVISYSAEDEAIISANGVGVFSAVTNLLTYSNQPEAGYWYLYESSVATDTQTGPDAETLAYKLIEGTETDVHSVRNFIYSQAAGAYTFSAFVKAAERTSFVMYAAHGDIVSIDVDLDAAEITDTLGETLEDAGLEELSDGWFRVWFRQTTTYEHNLQFRIDLAESGDSVSYAGDGASGLYIYGFNITETAYLAPYIETDSVAVTRALDTITMPMLGNLPNPASFTIMVDAQTPGVTGSWYRILYAPTTFHFSVAESGLIEMVVYTESGSVVQSFADTASDGYNLRLALTYDGETLTGYINGVKQSSTTASGISFDWSENICIGTSGTSRQLNGYIKNFRVTKQCLSGDQIAALGGPNND